MAITFDPNDGAHLAQNGSTALLNGVRELPPSQSACLSEFWTSSAARRLRDGNLESSAAWALYWRKRERPCPLAKLCAADTSPLGWGIDVASSPPATQTLLELLDQTSARAGSRSSQRTEHATAVETALSQWLAEDQAADMGLEFAISCLAAAHLLNDVGGALTPTLGWAVIDLLAAASAQAHDWQAEAELPPEAVIVEQILSGELPLTLSYLFPEMTPLRALRSQGRDRLTRGLGELLNGQGLPNGANISVLRPLAACWTRCRAIGTQFKQRCWSNEAEDQYQWVVQQAVRWTASNGAPLLGEQHAGPWEPEFLRTMLRLGGNRKDATAARATVGKRPSGKRGGRRGKLPAMSDDSEWSGLAVMRSEWSPSAPVVAVDYSTPEMKLEVWSEGRKLIDGIVAAAPQADGKPLHATGTWQNLCWFSDKDVDYLELRIDLVGGAWLERQILLARRDGVLLLADHLQHTQSSELRHEWQLPLAPGLLFCGEGETRDALLVDGTPLARLIPLALLEWRIDPRVGELSCDANRVQLSQQATARAIACPLFVDLKSSRCAKPSTWRHLTVAESLEIQSPETAVGYRIQCGKQQWLYYRSLAPRGNRTLMGQNTSSEFLMARFLPSKGAIKELIEIEG